MRDFNLFVLTIVGRPRKKSLVIGYQAGERQRHELLSNLDTVHRYTFGFSQQLRNEFKWEMSRCAKKKFLR